MVFVTGDFHADWGERERFVRSLSKDDILITLGDWGWCWNGEIFKHYLRTRPKCMQLWVDGNHENFEYLNTFPIVERFGGRCHQLADNCYHLMRGEMYEIEGKKFLAFGGAGSIDKDMRTPYVSWWPEEIPYYAEYLHALDTLKRNDWKFDYLLTHTCSDDMAVKMLGYDDIIPDPTGEMISSMIEEIYNNGGSFTRHLFGHHHMMETYYGDKYDSMCLYEEILCLDTGEIKEFDF